MIPVLRHIAEAFRVGSFSDFPDLAVNDIAEIELDYVRTAFQNF